MGGWFGKVRQHPMWQFVDFTARPAVESQRRWVKVVAWAKRLWPIESGIVAAWFSAHFTSQPWRSAFFIALGVAVLMLLGGSRLMRRHQDEQYEATLDFVYTIGSNGEPDGIDLIFVPHVPDARYRVSADWAGFGDHYRPMIVWWFGTEADEIDIRRDDKRRAPVLNVKRDRDNHYVFQPARLGHPKSTRQDKPDILRVYVDRMEPRGGRVKGLSLTRSKLDELRELSPAGD